MDVATLDEILKGMRSLFTLTTTTASSSSGDSDELRNLWRLLEAIYEVLQQVKQNHPQSECQRWLQDFNVMVEELTANATRQEQSKKRNIRSFLFKCKFNRIRCRVKPKYTFISAINNLLEALEGLASVTRAEDPQKGRELANLDDEFETTVEPVGREKEKKEIIDQLILLCNKNEQGVVSIVGIAGIGKTQLAHLVYEDELVKHQFRKRVWVHVHEMFDWESIVNHVTKSAAASDKNCFYLVVLDDLQVQIEEKDLRVLQHKLTEVGLSAGAILITTRSSLIARNIADNQYALQLQGLNKWGSFSLFRNICGRDASDAEKNIVRKCRGAPLVIVTLARLLLSCGGYQHDEAELKEELERVLKFIYYDNLPMLQKCCFAYCSLFPINYSIDAERLIHLWMGEGFLSPWNLSLENQEGFGRVCFNEFLGRSIFEEEVKEGECGVVRSYKMNWLMHDLASVVAMEKNITMRSNRRRIPNGVERVSFHFVLDVSCGIKNQLFQNGEKLRTILLLAKSKWRHPHEVKMSFDTCDKIFQSFKSLHVLDLHDLGIEKVPSSIVELNDLRYLDLSENNMEKLPNSITKLSNLQTLKLSQCHHLKELPKDLKDLSRLRHLDIEGCLDLTRMPCGMNNLTSLQTLSLYVANNKYHIGGLKELVDLNRLRGHLEILHLEQLNFSASSLKSKHAYLEGKQHLQGLTLSWDHDDVRYFSNIWANIYY